MTMKRIYCAVAMLALMGSMTSKVRAQDNDDTGVSTTTAVTAATGTITQVNYGEDGTVQSFLIGTNILLSFPSNVCGGVSSLGAVGNVVTYSGTARTNTTTGFQSVTVTSLVNSTTKATYTKPVAATAATVYGPVSGIVTALNYDSSGAIDGFLFSPTGGTTAVLVSIGSGASATLKPLLTVGGTVTVTGQTSTTSTGACVVGSAVSVVQPSSLIINGQTIVISSGHNGGGHH